MIDFRRLQQVSFSVLFVVFFLCAHFLIRLGIMISLPSGSFCNPVGPFGIFLPEWLIIGIGFLSLAFIFSFVLRNQDFYSRWPWLLLFSAGLSNFLERIFFGCILDYISVPSFPLFNGADVVLTLGALVLLGRLLFSSKE